MPKIPESVLVVIHTPDREVLLLERADAPGFWQSVTGSRDSLDEPLEECARREVYEETGLDTGRYLLADWKHSIEYDIYTQWRWRYAEGVTRNTEHWFGLLVPHPLPVVIAPREHLQYQWMPYLEACDRCFSPSNSDAIREAVSRLERAP